MEVRGSLGDEGTIVGSAGLGSPEPLKALLDYGGVLAMVVRVHLDIRGGDVNLVAVVVYAVVMRLLSVVRALPGGVPLGAVVGGRVTHESVLQRLVALFVPLEVSYHLLLLDEHAPAAVETVEVLAAAQILAVRATALLAAAVAAHVSGVVYQRLLLLLTRRRRRGRGCRLRAANWSRRPGAHQRLR